MQKGMFWVIAAGFAIATGCGEAAVKQATTVARVSEGTAIDPAVLVHPEWARSASIYEVNIRQHTPEGTFKALEADLPRIQALGSDILWLMPIHPIGEQNRKGGENANNYIAEPGSGSLGSPYSAKDYKGVNPEFGTLEDFKSLVNRAHELGMKVILDWVANHTAFDSKWTEEHREFFLLDSLGELQPPIGTDWWDVTQLDWENGKENGLYAAMEDAMLYWIVEADIDGYRCDVAEKVPTEFWTQVRLAMEEVKRDVFMLAEADKPEHHERAFDMSYVWEGMHVMDQVGGSAWPLDSLRAFMKREEARYPREAYRMFFVTNHDENAWKGTVAERHGENAEAMTVVASTLFGMPLIYSGQEAPNDKRLRFFEKDTVNWKDYGWSPLFTQLNALKESESALWNGADGAWPELLATEADEQVFAYRRAQEGSEVVVAANLSGAPQSVALPVAALSLYAGAAASNEAGTVTLSPRGYAIWTRK